MFSKLAFAAAAFATLAAIAQAEIRTVSSGMTQAFIDTAEPFKLRVNKVGVTIDGDGATYIQQEYTGVALVDAAGATVTLLSDTITDQGGTILAETDYYYAALSAKVGADPSVVGAWIGSANYLARNEFSYNKVPIEGTQYCVTAPTSVGVCPTMIDVSPGDFKFSIGVMTLGSAFAVPDGATHFRVQMTYTFVGSTTGLSVFFNGDRAMTTPGTGQLTSMTFVNTGEDEEATWNLEQNFILDDTTSVPMVIKGTATMDGTVPTLVVNYDMSLSGVTTSGQTMLYDPSISVAAGAGSAGGAATTAVSVAAIVVAAAATLRL